MYDFSFLPRFSFLLDRSKDSRDSSRLLRAQKDDREAVSDALGKLMKTEKWKQLTSQEQRTEAIRAKRERVLAVRKAQGLSGK